MSDRGQASSTSARRRILIVEDELMIRMLLEDMLLDLGLEVAGAAGRLEEAVELAKHVDIDAAILDVNMNGQPIMPVVDILAARQLPFVFATGYGERGIPQAYRGHPVLQKPFQLENLKRVLAEIGVEEKA
jgi:CheY-like chemotaxis protein